MFEFTIRRDGDDEPFTISGTTRDVLKWEKTNKKHKSLASLEKDVALEDIYMIAFYAAQRTAQFSGSLKEFEEQCDVEFEEMDEPGPTEQGRST